jgi:hypothetical protein
MNAVYLRDIACQLYEIEQNNAKNWKPGKSRHFGRRGRATW